MSIIEEAIAGLKAKSIYKPRVSPAPSNEQIAEAEAQIGCKFPPSYLTFLALCGSYQLPYWETYWVGPSDRQDIVEMNQQERKDTESPLPPYLVAFFNNGMGDQVCFDTRTVDTKGECSIVFWNHDLSPLENLKHLEQIAPNFAEWLMEEVTREG